MRVKPQEGKIVRDPNTGNRLPAGGANVPRNSFWNRRVAAGDVVPAEAAIPSAPAEEPAPVSAGKSSRSSNKNK